jgi:hypothetical protein
MRVDERLRGGLPVTDATSSDSHAASPSAIMPNTWALEVATASAAAIIAARCASGEIGWYSIVRPSAALSRMATSVTVIRSGPVSR